MTRNRIAGCRQAETHDNNLSTGHVSKYRNSQVVLNVPADSA
jgi:hypothetical protein